VLSTTLMKPMMATAHSRAKRSPTPSRRESRPLSGATISFGLVTIPVELRTATKSLAPSFHLIPERCGYRIQQQFYCPACKRVVERGELVRGYELRKDEYVTFTPEELKSLEGEASRVIDIAEFVPLSTIDPIYFETAYYLSPREGGEKAYRLLTEAMADSGRAALATFVMRGKENLVAIRTADHHLVLHTLFFADEVHDAPRVSGDKGAVRGTEVQLAKRLIDELASESFKPERFEDAYRQRVLEAAKAKAKGQTLKVEEPGEPRARVVDIMDALKASLERRRRPAPAVTARHRSARGDRKAG
jgi:DNA end-binding protein Ku